MANESNSPQQRPKLSETVLYIRALMLGKVLHAPVLRPHTWVFLRQRDNPKEPVIHLGIVFHTWPRKFNMLRFTTETDQGEPIVETARFTAMDNGAIAVVLNRRWCWDTLLHRYKGLSAGNL